MCGCWDSRRLGVVTEDLAYMVAVYWYPDRRRLMEGRLLEASASIPTVIWWNNFERIHLAVEDLECRQLLE